MKPKTVERQERRALSLRKDATACSIPEHTVVNSRVAGQAELVGRVVSGLNSLTDADLSLVADAFDEVVRASRQRKDERRFTVPGGTGSASYVAAARFRSLGRIVNMLPSYSNDELSEMADVLGNGLQLSSPPARIRLVGIRRTRSTIRRREPTRGGEA